MRLNRERCRNWVVYLAVVMLALTVVQPVAAEGDIPFAPARSQMVRVHLTRLELEDRMDVTLDCDYRMTAQDGSIFYFRKGSNLTFLLRNGSIYLYYENLSADVGGSVMLERAASPDTEATGFYLTNYPALYLGNLQLDLVDGALRPILHIHVEDYLLGVVPYEMSDTFPLEALKTQAVAARTYALRHQSASKAYDLVDTPTDQVFKGYQPDNPLSEQAVAETRGICGFYKGKLAQCYYSASNGGQMEPVESVWPTDDDYSYYTSGEDPYDLANPLSVVRSFKLSKECDDEGPYVLRRYISEVMGDQLAEMGYDPALESIRIDGVSSAVLDTPDRPDSKLMTMLHLTLRLSVRTRSDATVRVVDADAEEVSLFAQQPNITFAPVVTPAPTATPEPVYSDFEPLEEEVKLDIPVFPTAEDLFGMDILSNYDNEIWSVAETEDAFVLEARRYGHGVGMSQRGAQWMAAEEGKTFREVMAFYYPGMQLMRYPDEPVELVQAEDALAVAPGPAPSPTPRPSLMPVTRAAEENQYYAVVTEIADNSTLNLRSEPSMNSDVLMRMYKHQRLLVLEECPEEGWLKVCTDTSEGYVMESFLTKEQ